MAQFLGDVQSAGTNGRPSIEPDLYDTRFSPADTQEIQRLWGPICEFLQRWVKRDGTTIDIGAGSCHFINSIESKRAIAVDINERNLARYAAPRVERLICSAVNLAPVAGDSVDTAFASNIYEHFTDKDDVAHSVAEVFRVLKPGGRFIIMQPNFRHCVKSYFDFFDHRLAFTENAMSECLRSAGFDLERVYSRFLPYSTKSKLPRGPAFVRLYLRMPLAWRLLGKQMLIIARKPL